MDSSFEGNTDGTIHQSPTNRIFIGNLASELEEFTIYKYCSAYGEIVKCQIMKEPKTDKSRGFGFITYAQTSSTEAILDARPHYIGHHKINVRPAFPTTESLSQNCLPISAPTRRLFIAYNIEEAKRNNLLQPALFGYLTTFGVVKEILHQFSSSSSQLALVFPSLQPLNDYWIVEFLDEESVEKCMKIGPLHYFSGVRFYVKRVVSEQDILRRKRKIQQMEEAVSNSNSNSSIASLASFQSQFLSSPQPRKMFATPTSSFSDNSLNYPARAGVYGSSHFTPPPPPPSQRIYSSIKTTMLPYPSSSVSDASVSSSTSAEDMLKGYGYH
ncbi:RRM domain-containing protein [Meloidogyne graminicola]|uniref:RRM domain-containing protein n=1 Tax=Meloidogyne graminicola TaxID=189291 RepID=A0A8S9ZXR7_9BILA|nr:RRM domain-containing protein [Meloidogyne graminicola]